MLIEMALVVLLMAIILVPVLGLLSTQHEKDQTHRELLARRQILEAVEGFVLASGRLPCPAQVSSSVESRTGDGCTQSHGWLPTSTLGLWGIQGHWKIAVATLAHAGEPAQNTLVSSQPFSDISPQQLSEIILAPTTSSFATGSGPLPAIHLCEESQSNPLPLPVTPGCGMHPLLSVSAVWVAYPANDPINTDRYQQFFINPQQMASNPVWLSFERMNWLWMKRGSLDTFYIQEN